MTVISLEVGTPLSLGNCCLPAGGSALNCPTWGSHAIDPSLKRQRSVEQGFSCESSQESSRVICLCTDGTLQGSYLPHDSKPQFGVWYRLQPPWPALKKQPAVSGSSLAVPHFGPGTPRPVRGHVWGTILALEERAVQGEPTETIR